MANSVSKINVVVGANTAGLTAGMNQAAATVGGGMSKVQGIAQSATFAVDDFFAAFATGGVAGGLRGAGNNLTMIAAQLGSIKAQLLIIAALAVGQFIAKQFGVASSSAEKLKEQIDRVADAQKRLRDIRESARSAIEEIFQSNPSSPDAAKRLNQIRGDLSASSDKLARLQADRQQTASRYIPGTAEGNEEVMSHFRKIRDEELKDLGERIAAETKVNEILKSQETAQTAVARRAREAAKAAKAASDAQQLRADQDKLNQPFITSEMRSLMAGQIMDVDAEITALREGMRPSLSMADMFRMMPGAHSMGSSGAISSIAAANIGPQNARDAGQALQRQMAGDMKRIRELEEKKKGLLEVIGL